jgi:hypothetical protein
MNTVKWIKWIVMAVIGIIALVCIFYLAVLLRGCGKTIKAVKGIGQTIEQVEDRTWAKPENPEAAKPVKPIIKQRIIGQDGKPRLEIIVPPSKDTTKLLIPGGEEVYVKPESANVIVTLTRPALIRIAPTLHFTAVSDFKTIGFGLKLRVIEIWRFGACGYYVNGMGPGAGIDLRIISNLSIDAIQFINQRAMGISIKL